jgi:hypothetical protein
LNKKPECFKNTSHKIARFSIRYNENADHSGNVIKNRRSLNIYQKWATTSNTGSNMEILHISTMGSYIKNIEKRYFRDETDSDSYMTFRPALPDVLAEN